MLIEQQNYSHINTYVFKAESALDIPAVGGAAGLLATAPKKAAPNPDREKIQAKLDFSSALAHLGQGNYDKAAYGFTKLGRGLDDWAGKACVLLLQLSHVACLTMEIGCDRR